MDIVPHANLVTVVDDRSAGERHQHAIHQLDSPSIIVKQGSKASPDAQIQPHRLVPGIQVIHVITFDVSNHFQRQFIMVPQKEAPLTGGGDLGRLLQNLGDRLAIFQP